MPPPGSVAEFFGSLLGHTLDNDTRKSKTKCYDNHDIIMKNGIIKNKKIRCFSEKFALITRRS